MKKTILIMIILCLPLAYALYGGETWTYNFPECKELKINITAIDRIDEGEYTILNNCTKNDTNYYVCDCEDDYFFNVSFKINAVNNYTFDFNYAYSEVIEEQTSGGGGSSSSSSSKTKVCTPYWKCTEWGNSQPNSRATRTCNDLNECNATKPKEERYCYYYKPKEEPIEEPIEETVEQPQEGTEPPTEEQEESGKKGISLMWWIIIGVFIIIVIIVIIYLVKSYEWG